MIDAGSICYLGPWLRITWAAAHWAKAQCTVLTIRPERHRMTCWQTQMAPPCLSCSKTAACSNDKRNRCGEGCGIHWGSASGGGSIIGGVGNILTLILQFMITCRRVHRSQRRLVQEFWHGLQQGSCDRGLWYSTVSCGVSDAIYSPIRGPLNGQTQGLCPLAD